MHSLYTLLYEASAHAQYMLSNSTLYILFLNCCRYSFDTNICCIIAKPINNCQKYITF